MQYNSIQLKIATTFVKNYSLKVGMFIGLLYSILVRR